MPRPLACRTIPLVALLALCVLTVRVSLAWPTDPMVNVPVATGFGQQIVTSLVADGSGGAIVIWADSTGSSHYDVRAKHVLANGVIDPTWPAGGVAICTASGVQYSPLGVSDNAGGAIIVWPDQRAGNFDIYAHHLLANGTVDPAWPVDGAVVAGGTGDQFAGSFTNIIPDGAGGAITTWVDSRTGDRDIYVHHLLASGVDPGWPANGRAVCTAAGTQSTPSLIIVAAGGAIVAWDDSRAGGSNSDIYAHRVLASGALSGDFPVNGLAVSTAANTQSYPEGQPDGAGGALLVWQDRRGGADSDIYAHHVMSNGIVSPSVPVDGVAVCIQPFTQGRARAVPDGSGGMFVTWHDARDGVSESVFVHHLIAGGQVDPAYPAHGLPVRLQSGVFPPGVVPYRGFVSDNAGGAIITWQDFRDGGGDNDVYAQRIRPGGVIDPAWPAGGRAVSTAPLEQLSPFACALGNGRFLIAWSDTRNAQRGDVYAQRLTATGVLGGADYVGSGQSLPQLRRGSLDWGDYDGDGDLDLLLTGTDGGQSRTYLYANNAGTFTDVGAALPAIEWSSAEWGDYDGDGDLDIAMAGLNNTVPLARIYRNDGGTFTDISANLPGVWKAAVAWGDVDSDGDLDLFLGGQQNNTVPIARVYLNNEGTFNDMNAGLMGVIHCDADWGDVDHDGDVDLLVAGSTGAFTWTVLYINDGGNNFASRGGLPGVEAMDGSLAFGDYDADGDLDILISGWDETNRHLDIYRNDGLGTFSDIDANLPGLSSSAVAWGDYDNDGDLDILASGYWGGGSNGRSDIYCNDNGTFINAGAGLPNRYYSAVAWADYDNDGDLDVTISGTTNDANALTGLFDSEGTTPNTPPPAPTGLSAVRLGNIVTFSWTAPTDTQTPTSGLSYNLRVGTAVGGNDAVPSMSGANGFRRIVRVGNAGRQTSFGVFLDQVPYSWSVQAVDGAFAGSPWAIGAPVVGVEDEHVAIAPGLHGASPNPFRTSTEISFALSRAGKSDVSVYDLSGRRVRVLERGERAAGPARVTWDGRGMTGARLPAGLYLVRFESEAGTFSRMVVLAD